MVWPIGCFYSFKRLKPLFYRTPAPFLVEFLPLPFLDDEQIFTTLFYPHLTESLKCAFAEILDAIGNATKIKRLHPYPGNHSTPVTFNLTQAIYFCKEFGQALIKA